MDNKKLVSKNSVLKFKYGKKIVKADNGIVLNILGHKTEIGPTASKVLRKMKRAYNYYKVLDARTPVPDPFRYLDNKIGKAINWMDNTFVIKDGYTPENGGTINNRLREQQLLPRVGIRLRTPDEILKLLDPKIQKYLQRLQALGFTAKPSVERKVGTKGISFKQAFNNARNSGLKEFTWNGKRFNTQVGNEKGYIWSDQHKKWINSNISFTVPTIVESTKEEMDELNRKAKPIINFTVPSPADMTSEEIGKLNSKAKPIWEGALLAKNGGTLKSHKSVIQRFRERK